MINDDDLLQDIKEAVEDIILSTKEVDENVLDIYNRLTIELEDLKKIKKPTRDQQSFIRAANNLNESFARYLNTRGIDPTTHKPKKGTTLCNTEEKPNKNDDDSEPKS
tara:strand:+ start:247 stop:570 length:324 start_codon:yes stop_codon:yes gene_type:complete